MRLRIPFAFMMLLIVFSPPLRADGKVYVVREEVPANMQYQRGFINYHNGEELLILQAKFEGTAKDFGWIIPIPNVPEIAVISEGSEDFFDDLNYNTQPRTIRITNILAYICLFSFPIIILYFILHSLLEVIIKKELRNIAPIITLVLSIFLLICILSIFITMLVPIVNIPEYGMVIAIIPFVLIALVASIKALREELHTPIKIDSKATLTALILSLLSACYLLLDLGSMGTGMVKEMPVEILKTERVGVYDIKVVKAQKVDALVEWLNENKYSYNEQDKAIFQDYIKRNWVFVTAKIIPEKKEEFKSKENLVKPLVMVFNSKEMVYPLKLTSLAGKGETEILLYILGEHKVKADRRFKVEYAGEWKYGERFLNEFFVDKEHYQYGIVVDPPDFFKKVNPALLRGTYITKMRAKLKPGKMKDDVIISTAEDDKPYRKTVIRWFR